MRVQGTPIIGFGAVGGVITAVSHIIFCRKANAEMLLIHNASSRSVHVGNRVFVLREAVLITKLVCMNGGCYTWLMLVIWIRSSGYLVRMTVNVANEVSSGMGTGWRR